MASFWSYIASSFQKEPGVLGYELMNEPWVGNIYRDASFLLPGVAGRKNLVPFYERLHRAIRKIDNDKLVFWEPVTYSYWFPIDPHPIYDDLLELYMRKHSMGDFLPILSLFCGETGNDTSFSASPFHELNFLFGEWSYKKIEKLGLASSKRSVFGTGFSTVPGGSEYINRSVLSWHYYCPALGLGPSNQPYDQDLQELCDNIIIENIFKSVNKRAKDELGGTATILTEFGLCLPNITEPETQNTIECNFVINRADKDFLSWAYWDTYEGNGFWNSETGLLMPERVKVFARPYPRAIAGIPMNLKFDIFSREFSFSFVPNPQLENINTELFIPELQYPNQSYTITTSSDLTWTRQGDLVLFQSDKMTMDETVPSWIHISATY